MYLKKLANRKIITIEYDTNGHLKTFKGRVYYLDLPEQTLSIKDEQQLTHTFKLSGIRKVY